MDTSTRAFNLLWASHVRIFAPNNTLPICSHSVSRVPVPSLRGRKLAILGDPPLLATRPLGSIYCRYVPFKRRYSGLIRPTFQRHHLTNRDTKIVNSL